MTAGWDVLGDFAPKFAELNDSVLLGQVWVREEQLLPRDCSAVTVTAPMVSGAFNTSLRVYIEIMKSNGIARDEMVEILTYVAFYVGRLKARAAFRYAKEIYAEQIFTVL